MRYLQDGNGKHFYVYGKITRQWAYVVSEGKSYAKSEFLPRGTKFTGRVRSEKKKEMLLNQALEFLIVAEMKWGR